MRIVLTILILAGMSSIVGFGADAKAGKTVYQSRARGVTAPTEPETPQLQR